MMPRSVVLRAAAHRDVDEAVAHYVAEGGTEVALGFIDALEDAFRHVADNPGSGSPRYGQELNLPGLRSWPLKPYPHIVFLHGRRWEDRCLANPARPSRHPRVDAGILKECVTDSGQNLARNLSRGHLAAHRLSNRPGFASVISPPSITSPPFTNR